MTRLMGISELFLAHAFTLLVWALFVRREVRVNAAMIVADGAADTLHQGFHRRRTSIRALAAGALGVVGSLPAWGAWAIAGLSTLALLLLLAGYFIRTFNPALNRARGLDYVARFYVSPSQNAAAFPDRCIWRLAKNSNPGQTTTALQDKADRLNHGLLNLLFIACLLGYLTLVVIALKLR
jgi:hypothetical protein